MNPRIRTITVLTLGLLAVVFFFRLTMFSGFEFIPGDVWDGRLLFAIVDHWRQFFYGECAWNDMRMFWPVENTLAYSDTFFLQGVPYTILCGLGVDRLIAYALVFIGQAYVGYLSMYWLLKRFFAVPWLPSAAFAALFINLASMQLTLDSSHLQLFVVWFCPLFVCLVWKALEDARRAWMWACGAGVLLSAMFFSAYYVTWFLFFYLCVAACLWVLVWAMGVGVSPEGGFVSRLRGGWCMIRSRWRALCAFALSFVVTMLPFFALYLPAARLFGRRSFSDVLKTLPGPIDFINVSDRNLFWGWYARELHLSSRPWGAELNFGLTPLVMAFFLAVLLWLSVGFFRRRLVDVEGRVALLAGVCAVLLWGVIFRWGADSAWYFVLKLVPGANAMRVVYRMNLFLAFPVVVVCAVGGGALWKKGAQFRWGLVAALAVLFAGQYCHPWVSGRFRRSEEERRMAFFQTPPKDARVFYVIPRKGDDRWAMLVNQTTALIVAGRTGLGTINGYSGQFPAGWNLDALGNRYFGSVAGWLARYGIESGVYGLDMETGRWLKPELVCEMHPWMPGVNIVQGGVFEQFAWMGWSGVESWGAWSDGQRSELAFSLPDLSGSVKIEAEFHVFTPGGRPQRVQMLVNGREAGAWTVSDGTHVKPDILVPAEAVADGRLKVVFLLPDAISPQQLHNSGDGRLLGVGLSRFVLSPAK
jgi:hypothetical protein